MKLAVVLPCFNESEILSISAQRLIATLDVLVAKKKIDNDSFMLFVNDGSLDATWAIISELFRDNKHIFGISLSNNVGQQGAIMAGLEVVSNRCDAVITIDADLQDDLGAIEQMVDRCREGYDVVYGVKVSRKCDSLFKRSFAQGFYRFQHIVGIKSVYNHADFRLLSKNALQKLLQLGRSNIYIRGVVPLLGCKSTTVDDIISSREAGCSKYTIKKMFFLAIYGITSLSARLLCLIFYFSIFFIAMGIIMLFFSIICSGFSDNMMICSGVILLLLGVMGQYIYLLHKKIESRPSYRIEKVLIED